MVGLLFDIVTFYHFLLHGMVDVAVLLNKCCEFFVSVEPCVIVKGNFYVELSLTGSISFGGMFNMGTCGGFIICAQATTLPLISGY